MVAALILVGVAGSVSVVFHTVTNNRILTPSLMGMESLYVLVQTSLVFFGVNRAQSLPPTVAFVVQTALMVGMATLLFGGLLSGNNPNLMRLLLVGLVSGIMFQSMATLMQRILAPSEYAIVLSRTLASFTNTSPKVVVPAYLIVICCLVLLWRWRRSLDVLALGRDNAVALGIDHSRFVRATLCVIALMVATCTAVAGPLTFFGFLVATLTYQLVGSSRHGLTLPVSAVTGVLVLTGGQWFLTHILHSGALGVVIEFIGGGIFLAVLLRRKAIR